jgi:hypothetical protein
MDRDKTNKITVDDEVVMVQQHLNWQFNCLLEYNLQSPLGPYI